MPSENANPYDYGTTDYNMQFCHPKLQYICSLDDDGSR